MRHCDVAGWAVSTRASVGPVGIEHSLKLVREHDPKIAEAKVRLAESPTTLVLANFALTAEQMDGFNVASGSIVRWPIR